jgi:hypothetical protein
MAELYGYLDLWRGRVMKGWKFVVALLVVVVVVALIVPVAGVASVGSGPVAVEYRGGIQGSEFLAGITPTPAPPNPDVECQSGTACGG